MIPFPTTSVVKMRLPQPVEESSKGSQKFISFCRPAIVIYDNDTATLPTPDAEELQGILDVAPKEVVFAVLAKNPFVSDALLEGYVLTKGEGLASLTEVGLLSLKVVLLLPWRVVSTMVVQ